MSPTAASKFRSIRDFPELVEYLGDELDWPIETDDFEEMTFEYSAAELGLDEKTAPKFVEIRRLRPLDKDQPWGIFFIRFDDNKLPVVALRRLLSKLVLKKRSTSNSGDRASWHESDLLLISQTGNLGTQSISFAHFAANPEKTDLPILKVLGWDDDDTGLKIDYVIETLREKLIWPDDPTDSDAWRAQWRDAFTLKNREVIQSSKEMAERLGQLALAVRTRLREVLAIENNEGPIHKLMSVFKENLISDLDTDSFSDMYAQTIAYGLLSARIINPKANTADAAHTQIPITNPFLRDLMETFLNVGGRSHSGGVGLDFDELGINEVVDLLDNTNMEAVLRDFGDRNKKEDPVMHFFEGFLQEYDSKIRKDRGVFYTPQPVVSFIVRSVDEQLRTEFGLEDGLADTTTWGELAERTADLEIPEGTSPDQAFVQILDPATGTGTFPVEVIDLIYKTMAAKWQSQGKREAQIKELWNEYVPKFLLPRLHGYELMMAPYAIAHMKIGLKLYETGYGFKSDERARIYLTNALEPAQDFSGTFAFAIPALAREAEAVNAIKRDQRFTVVIGNPPYSLLSSNLGATQRAMVQPYKFIDGRQIRERGALQLEKNLNDDYVKFVRLGQTSIDIAGSGVLSLITNHSYLDNPTMRGLRWSLLQSASRIDVLDLHGNSTKKEAAPDGSIDKNVFAIKQGVAIIALTRRGTPDARTVSHTDLWGSSRSKEDWLARHQLRTLSAVLVEPGPDSYLFVPQDIDRRKEFDAGFPLQDMMPVFGAGYITARDKLVVDFDRPRLIDRVCRFRDSSLGDQELLASFDVVEKKGWDVAKARKRLRDCDVDGHIIPTNYRPFDERHIFFDSSLVWGRSWPTMKHIVGDGNNLSLLATRMTKDKWEVFVSRSVSSHKAMSAYDTNSVFPLYLREEENGLFVESPKGLRPNYSRAFLDVLSSRLGCSGRCENGLPSNVGADEIFYYAYAVFQSPGFRQRYHDLLVQEFPRLPLTSNLDLFFSMHKLGEELAAVHLLESPVLDAHISKFVGAHEFEVQKVSYSDETVWIDKAKTCGFKGVSEEVWSFHIGGYQVCEKWLKDRQAKSGKNPCPGHVLTDEDIEHYQKIVVALTETNRITAKIDEVIDKHGGWPDAFITANS